MKLFETMKHSPLATELYVRTSFWYEGGFIEQEGSRRDSLFVFSKTMRKEGTDSSDLISQKYFYF
ncbi:unnamed protein product [Bathycoccus prasinos]